MASKKNIVKDVSTQEKIKNAAQEVFTNKGYAATRTRDIAEAAGINLALLNYYFRSKENLFDEIMLEKIQLLFGKLMPIMNDDRTSVQSKVELIVESYIDLLIENPDLPVFVMSELRSNSDRFLLRMRVDVMLRESHFVRQIKELHPDRNPVHYLMSILGMVIFPFVMKPVFISIGGLDDAKYRKMMLERKKLIPMWVKSILET